MHDDVTFDPIIATGHGLPDTLEPQCVLLRSVQDGLEFQCRAGESVLEAGLRAWLPPDPHRSAAQCRARPISKIWTAGTSNAGEGATSENRRRGSALSLFQEKTKMRRAAVGALVAILFSVPAFAQMADLDTDGDGMASFDEVISVYNSVTEDTFGAMDTNGDGALDEAEMTAAVDAGTLVKDAG